MSGSLLNGSVVAAAAAAAQISRVVGGVLACLHLQHRLNWVGR